MIVDAHAHIFLRADASARGSDELIPAEREAPVERLRVAMDGAGVDRAVLVGVDPADVYVPAVRRERADVFAAIAVATPEELGRVDGVDPVAALERRREGLGLDGADTGGAASGRREPFEFDGLRTGWLGEPGRPLADSPALPALRRLAEWGLPLWSYLAPDQMSLLLELPEVVDGLTVVLNHLGFFPEAMRVDELGRPAFDDALVPERIEAVLGLSRHPAVVMMISGQYALSAESYPHPDLDELIGRSVEAFGPERCMWGSDFPWTEREPGYAETLALVERALPGANAEDLAAIRGGTALRLFPNLAERGGLASHSDGKSPQAGEAAL
ncbi:MAG TPA: amidohydrolase family protein [Solirubrobacterales bacterium]|jgi:predicted TIM-barrel fold metal-dependent hydrolase